ncbi:MAG: thiamine phosphate synthase [Eubacteriales bacterium]|jgi:thiamine-phosphate pyrophosphorylase|nr:thiamine phosphate synthase [Bacillota bacterium]MBV1727620.1 thiamine phosphate synthase [Desulforudis sp.]MDQ7790388.1 thiamine phosphate synthase [Clostridia bacterium]MDZ4044119.1 thiamine phosphate synthase [Eubacteriales bacterium]MBU4534214.1 thiamine phosphate synthase [Bacillota bacterium]
MKEILRIADVNLNRAREGLRIIEEMARFKLADSGLTAAIKDLRHKLSRLEQEFPGGRADLIAARDTANDIGALTWESRERRSFLDSAGANWKRVQEATRVLEELARGSNPSLAHRIKEIRFEAYTREQEFTAQLFARQRSGVIGKMGLYLVIGSKNTKGRPIINLVREAIQGGVGVVQLREKHASASEILPLAHNLAALCKWSGIPFIINDRVDIASAVDADGVHLGQDDLPIEEARRILGWSKVIGVSTHTLKEALDAEERGADYIGVGPVFDTPTKGGRPAVGIDLVRSVVSRIGIPFVAIGGINQDNCAEVLQAGARHIAVVRALGHAPEVHSAAQTLSEIIKHNWRDLVESDVRGLAEPGDTGDGAGSPG